MRAGYGRICCVMPGPGGRRAATHTRRIDSQAREQGRNEEVRSQGLSLGSLLSHEAWGLPSRRWSLLQLLLFPAPAMTGLHPSRMGSFPIEVKTAAPTHAAVMCAEASEGRLRRPGKRTLFDGKDVKLGDDLVDSEQAGRKRLHLRRRAGSNLTIRRCMSLLHDRIRGRYTGSRNKGCSDQPRAVAHYL
jgi:hypothetical protein